MRALQARQVLGKQRGQLSPDDELAIQSPLRKLKSMFPNTPLAKHTPLDILTTAPSPKQPRTLIVRDLGSVQSEWLAREFILAYFEGQGLSPPVSSPLSCEARLLPKTDSLPSSRSRWWSMLRSTCNCCVFGQTCRASTVTLLPNNRLACYAEWVLRRIPMHFALPSAVIYRLNRTRS